MTVLDGNYEGRSGSRIMVGADFAAGTADRLDIRGDATFAGGVEVRPATLRKGSVEIARVAGHLTLGDEWTRSIRRSSAMISARRAARSP